jgi:hypothetical protein
MFMRYLGDGIGHLVQNKSAWQGNNDGDVNGLPSDDTEPTAPTEMHGSTDDTVDVDVQMEEPGEEEDVDDSGEKEEDVKLGGDDDGNGDESEEEDQDLDKSDDESEDVDLFDDEGFLDI